MPEYSKGTRAMQKKNTQNKKKKRVFIENVINCWEGMWRKYINSPASLKGKQKAELLFFQSMKLAKAIECGGEEMSGRNRHMWNPKAVNN